MALGFSGGLLTGLQQFGQGGGAMPSDPRQRNAIQAAGVTNPLLQQFGMGLGGLLGTEMRSPAAIAQAEQKTQQEQARQVYSQALSASPEKQLELASQLMNISGYETAAMQLAQQAQAKIDQGQKQLEQGQEEIASSLNQTKREQSLASAIQEKNPELASLIRQGDPDAYKRGVDLLGQSKFKISPKGEVVNMETGKIVSEPSKKTDAISPEQKTALLKTAGTLFQGEDLDSVTANINAGNITDAGDFKNYVRPLKETNQGVDISSAVEKKNMEYADKGAKALVSLNNIDNIFARASTEGIFDSSGGIVADVRKATLGGLGLRDTELKLRTAATKEINTEIINSLPPGVASDRDIEIFSRGFPPENATLDEIFEYLAAARNIHAATADVSIMYENHLQGQIQRGQSPTSIGFAQKQINYNSAINKLRNLTATAQTPEERRRAINNFQQAFGFIPTEFR